MGVLHDMSDPSTVTEVVRAAELKLAALKIDYGLLGLEHWMLDPGDGYPFVEWDDLLPGQRSAVLKERASWLVRLDQSKLTTTVSVWFHEKVVAVALNTDDHETAMKDLLVALTQAKKSSEEEREAMSQGLKPASPGHLMAEGNALARARDKAAKGTAYTRKVVFKERVKAYTMLYGDKIAKGGDMLTGCTITDTFSEPYTNAQGAVDIRYVAEAISL